MKLLVYYILRRFFVRLEFTSGEIRLEKGILIKRFSAIPISEITEITVKRALTERIFRAKEVIVETIGGKISFYLHKDERIPFLPEFHAPQIKPRAGEILLGAFIDTRALGGIFVFIAILRKIGAVFGDKIMTAISTAAENVSRILEILHIAVPKIAALLAVFALSSWIAAFLRKAMRLWRFSVSRQENLLSVKSGIVTLYERTLVLNSRGIFAVSPDTVTSVLIKRAPLYLRSTMIFPCVKRKKLVKTLRALCGIELPFPRAIPPKRAFLGYCIVPLGWSGAFAAALLLVYFTNLRSITLLKTVLYIGLIVSVYAVAVCMLYMRRSGIGAWESVNVIRVSERRGMRLYNSVFLRENIRMEKLSQSLFQRRSGLCNLKISTFGKHKFKARQLIKSEIPRCIRF